MRAIERFLNYLYDDNRALKYSQYRTTVTCTDNGSLYTAAVPASSESLRLLRFSALNRGTRATILTGYVAGGTGISNYLFSFTAAASQTINPTHADFSGYRLPQGQALIIGVTGASGPIETVIYYYKD